MVQVRRRLLLSLTAAAGLAPTVAVRAEPPPAGRRIAIGGYDPVAYFSDGQPQKGSEQHWFAFDDAIYLFRNAEHRAAFAGDPERYAPQYSAFCAAGVSKGYKTEPDPEAWAILNGKLYLFQLKERVPGFKQDPSFIEKANANWPSVKDQPIR